MNKYKNIVILTGAGISAESGVATFRDSGGLWAEYNVEDVATPEAYRRNPSLVHEFYNKRRREMPNVEPNAAHFALGRLEKEFDGEVLLVTQNVDNLHELGGSKNILHIHGELAKIRCTECEEVMENSDNIFTDTPCPVCESKGTLRPHIVWFGEMPFYMDKIVKALRECDLFISIGTSGTVYPAAGFVMEAKYSGAHTVELNLDKTGGSFDEHITGKATEVVTEYVDELLAN